MGFFSTFYKNMSSRMIERRVWNFFITIFPVSNILFGTSWRPNSLSNPLKISKCHLAQSKTFITILVSTEPNILLSCRLSCSHSRKGNRRKAERESHLWSTYHMPTTLLGPFCVFHHPSKKMYETGSIISILEMNKSSLGDVR